MMYFTRISTALLAALSPLQLIAAVGSIIAPFLIYLTYKWGQIPSEIEVENRLRNRLLENKFPHGDFVVQVTGIRAREETTWRAKLKRMFLFRTGGVVRVEMFILKSKVMPDHLWEGPLFEMFQEAREIDVEFVSSNIEKTDSTGLIFRVQTFSPDEVEDFVKTIPAYLHTLKEHGMLGRGAGWTDEEKARLEEFMEKWDSNE